MAKMKQMLENRLERLQRQHERLQRRIRAQEYLNRKAMEQLRDEEDELRVELAVARANLRYSKEES